MKKNQKFHPVGENKKCNLMDINPSHLIQIRDHRLPGSPYPDPSKSQIIGADPSSIWLGANGIIYFHAAKQ